MAEMTKPAAQPRAKRGEGPRIPMTAYVILSALGDMATPLWRAVNDVQATSSSAAIREHMRSEGIDARAMSLEPVLFVAIPKRSWRPIEVKVERTERLIVGPYEPSRQDAKPETEPEGQFDVDGIEREATPERLIVGPDVGPIRPIPPGHL